MNVGQILEIENKNGFILHHPVIKSQTCYATWHDPNWCNRSLKYLYRWLISIHKIKFCGQ
ncbi:hypothetical protein Hanom_Chr07g00650091 [Helianthus anomalus]